MSIDFEGFSKLNEFNKVNFIDDDCIDIYSKVESKQIISFFRKLFEADEISSYIKIKTIDRIIDLYHAGIIKKRNVLTILLDEWDNKNALVEVRRLKRLAYLYDFEKYDIMKTLLNESKNDEIEISTEAHYQLGIITLISSIEASDKQSYNEVLEKCNYFFEKAWRYSENRTDAKAFIFIVNALKYLLAGLREEYKNCVNELEKIVNNRVVLTFNEQHFVELKILISLRGAVNLINANPIEWVDFRDEISNMYEDFYEIRAFECFYANLDNSIKKVVLDNALVPYYKSEFSESKLRLNRLMKNEQNSEIVSFIEYLIKCIDEDFDKNDNYSFEQLKKLYPYADEDEIKRCLIEHKEYDNIDPLIRLISSSKKNYKAILQSIIYAGTAIMGNTAFKNASEDEMNKQIANILESKGFRPKDQTQYGLSPTGKSFGELDIQVVDDLGIPYTVIEGVVASYVDKKNLREHINKVFTYDALGVKKNFIVVYYRGKNFVDFKKNYQDFLKTDTFSTPLEKVIQEMEFSSSYLTVLKSTHKRDDEDVELYHIVFKVL